MDIKIKSYQYLAEIRELNSKILTQKAKVINANKLIKKYESKIKNLKGV